MPPEPQSPDAERGSGQVALRYEDVAQDGRFETKKESTQNEARVVSLQAVPETGYQPAQPKSDWKWCEGPPVAARNHQAKEGDYRQTCAKVMQSPRRWIGMLAEVIGPEVSVAFDFASGHAKLQGRR